MRGPNVDRKTSRVATLQDRVVQMEPDVLGDGQWCTGRWSLPAKNGLGCTTVALTSSDSALQCFIKAAEHDETCERVSFEQPSISQKQHARMTSRLNWLRIGTNGRIL